MSDTTTNGTAREILMKARAWANDLSQQHSGARSIQFLIEEAIEALAAQPDVWTRRPATGWTAKTLPEHGRFIVWLYANKIHVGKNRGGLFTADTYEVRADNIEWWRYVDLPDGYDYLPGGLGAAVARGTEGE